MRICKTYDEVAFVDGEKSSACGINLFKTHPSFDCQNFLITNRVAYNFSSDSTGKYKLKFHK